MENRTVELEPFTRSGRQALILIAAFAATGCKQTEDVAIECSVPVAPLTQRVTDLADVMSNAQESFLGSRLASFESRTGHQFVVASVKSLSGQGIDDFSLCLANKSRIGRKGQNDGILMLVAPAERKVRIEVGLGLEQALTDSEASSILEQHVLPSFKSGEFNAGINKAVDQIIRETQ